jgi:hypothetical protein
MTPSRFDQRMGLPAAMPRVDTSPIYRDAVLSLLEQIRPVVLPNQRRHNE